MSPVLRKQYPDKQPEIMKLIAKITETQCYKPLNL